MFFVSRILIPDTFISGENLRRVGYAFPVLPSSSPHFAYPLFAGTGYNTRKYRNSDLFSVNNTTGNAL